MHTLIQSFGEQSRVEPNSGKALTRNVRPLSTYLVVVLADDSFLISFHILQPYT